ncbi:hypothetical protein EDD90_4248 [Streptomyces sp. Ag109_O5-1]|uniref:hypothetical protein n=1 Tax=Streptomyces sp. Ag109_O5-1 TaxID=1938851 RepID=UPI000F4DB94A|nr:hypothetical protein [Streptomyces sp. Ag109_O5-1]RPE41168.1 hypothetical protein EDD90_4248 [Streptomyces sp. Ag109_O5-1]
MGTDIYGGIEFRHPYAGTEDYDGEPWVTAMDLWPLYDETDYTAFGLLFGVRNYAGFRPLAPGRGLPADLSSNMRSELCSWIDQGEMGSASWVSWAEIASIDPATAPEQYGFAEMSLHVPDATWPARATACRLRPTCSVGSGNGSKIDGHLS